MSEEPRDLNLMDRMIPMKGGKEYLQVADRIVWFRRDYPEGTIETKLLELDRDKGFAMYHARITTGKGGVAEASGSETAKDFGDYIEKSETKAVGRALGYLGFGTASAGFEEGQRIVDAPQQATSTRAPARRPDLPTDLRPAVAPQGGGPTPPAPPNPIGTALLEIIRDDEADPKERKRALHNYFAGAATMTGLNQRAEAVKGSGLPQADRDAGYRFHLARLGTEKILEPPASIAG